ncbi:MAG: hypothetical protein AAF628_03350 [Planctomycetota bacterium]
MTRLQRTVLTVAAAAFGAGIGTGLAVPVARAAMDQSPSGIHADFIERLRTGFNLTPQQVADVELFHRMFDDERMRVARDFDLEQWPPQARTRFREAHQRLQKRIEFVLDETQRELYRRQTRPQSAPPTLQNR